MWARVYNVCPSVSEGPRNVPLGPGNMPYALKFEDSDSFYFILHRYIFFHNNYKISRVNLDQKCEINMVCLKFGGQ